MKRAAAKVLRRDLDLETAPALLAGYAADRAEKMHGSMAFCADFLAEELDVPKVSEMDVIRLLHASDPIKRLEDLAGMHVPETRCIIASWDAWPD